MSSLRSVGRSAAARNNDRASLCSFTFADGRRCRTPRQSGHLQYCCDHARKQAQTQAAEEIGRDASYFFSGRFLSACDLNAALGRVFAATAQGHIKPKLASALAYLAQVMVQCIQITQHEYAGAFGGDGWRGAIKSSVNTNADYINPPEPVPPSTPVGAGETCPERSRRSPSPAVPSPAPQVHPDIGRATTSPPSPHTPMPPTSTEFVQQVLAGRNLSQSEIPTLSGSSRPPQASQGSRRESGSAATNSTPQLRPDPGRARPAPATLYPEPRRANPPSPLDASAKPDPPAPSPSSTPAPRRFGPPGIEGNPDPPSFPGPVHFPEEK